MGYSLDDVERGCEKLHLICIYWWGLVAVAALLSFAFSICPLLATGTLIFDVTQYMVIPRVLQTAGCVSD